MAQTQRMNLTEQIKMTEQLDLTDKLNLTKKQMISFGKLFASFILFIMTFLYIIPVCNTMAMPGSSNEIFPIDLGHDTSDYASQSAFNLVQQTFIESMTMELSTLSKQVKNETVCKLETFHETETIFIHLINSLYSIWIDSTMEPNGYFEKSFDQTGETWNEVYYDILHEYIKMYHKLTSKCFVVPKVLLEF